MKNSKTEPLRKTAMVIVDALGVKHPDNRDAAIKIINDALIKEDIGETHAGNCCQNNRCTS